MKNTNKGFTLVELIVVITILAILGTIAFISLQGYSQDAKNAKVSQDLNTLASAVEVALTDGTLAGISSLVPNNDSNYDLTTWTVTIFTKWSATGSTVNLSTLVPANKYRAGKIDFAAIRQNGDDFKDPEGKDYLWAFAYSGSTSYYQLAGQKKETSWEYKAIVKGNYVAQWSDVTGLISTKGTDTPVTNTTSSWSSILY